MAVLFPPPPVLELELGQFNTANINKRELSLAASLVHFALAPSKLARGKAWLAVVPDPEWTSRHFKGYCLRACSVASTWLALVPPPSPDELSSLQSYPMLRKRGDPTYKRELCSAYSSSIRLAPYLSCFPVHRLTLIFSRGTPSHAARKG